MSIQPNIAQERTSHVIVRILLLLTGVLFLLQCLSVAVFPIPDSLRWYGDESWLMLEARTHIATGVLRFPEAVGSTLAVNKGFLLGMPWISSLLYGLPVVLAGATADVVVTGRIVTLVLAVLLLIVLYRTMLRLSIPPILAALGLLLLVSSRSFFFASHSARPDILAGLTVLSVICYCTDPTRINSIRSSRWWFFFGAALSFIALTSSPHLPPLLAPLGVVALFFFKSANKTKAWLYSIVGAVSVAGVLVFLYYVLSGDLSLFGIHRAHNPFESVSGELPLHRPFSRSVQIANILIRLSTMWDEARYFLIALLLALAAFLLPSVRKQVRVSRERRFVLWSVLSLSFSWLYLEAAGKLYFLHVFPIYIIFIALVLSTLSSSLWKYLSIVGLLLFGIGLQDAFTARSAGEKIAHGNIAAVHQLADSIQQISQREHIVKPRVVTEPAAVDQLLQYPNVRTMTTHFISYYDTVHTIPEMVKMYDARFAILANTPSWSEARYKEPFFRTIDSIGRRVTVVSGTLFDFDQEYFTPQKESGTDSLILYQLPN